VDLAPQTLDLVLEVACTFLGGPSVLSRSSSAKPALTSTPSPAVHRRVASATLDHATARAVKARQTVNASPAPSEKENVEAARPASRARVPVPA
jgi:hypothetical protein